MLNEPQKIYLSLGEDIEPDTDFNELVGVSWCTDKVNANDIEYVRVPSAQVVSSLIEKCRSHIESMNMAVLVAGSTWDFEELIAKYEMTCKLLTVKNDELAKVMYEAGSKDGRAQVSRGYSYHFDRYLNPDHDKEEREMLESLNEFGFDKNNFCIRATDLTVSAIMGFINKPSLNARNMEWNGVVGRYYGINAVGRYASDKPFAPEITFEMFQKIAQ